MFEDNPREKVKLGDRIVEVIRPKEQISYEEGCKRIERIMNASKKEHYD